MGNVADSNLYPYFKSILEHDRSAVVLCNLQHEILYMNPAAISRYAKRGGAGLLGRNLLDCHAPESRERIRQVVGWFAESASHNVIYIYHSEKEDRDAYIVALRDDDGALIGYYEKHEYRARETDCPYHFTA